MTVDEILVHLPESTLAERRLIERAYSFAEHAHDGQHRKSGEPFFIHCEAVATILAEMKLDAATIAAALMHDVVEDTEVTLAQIEEGFSEEIARMVDGVTKMEKMPSTMISRNGHGDPEAEYLRKTIHSINNDVRIILIKLVDRLHNMRTLGYLKPERQRAISRQTMDYFAPLANRLGMWKLKAELEDLCFRYLEPDAYREIANKLNERSPQREHYLESVIDKLRQRLKRYNIEAAIYGRPKNVYSISRKMKRKGVSFEETYDVHGLRVIVDDMLTCYQVLGLVHACWRPVPGQFDDYIGSPKDNFYQSLHTAVFNEDGRTLEVQIRTWEMHYHAEYGIAAHWRYKQDMNALNESLQRRLDYLRQLIEPDTPEQDAEDYLKTVKQNIDSDRVYVFTPKGDVLDLPAGSTPIDFAYHIHTEVGHRCRAARVNAELQPLDYKLRSGDRVEIITANRGGPNLSWLDAELQYACTNRAVSKIQSWFRAMGPEQNIEDGRNALEIKMRQLGLAHVNVDDLVALTEYETQAELLEAIGQGKVSPSKIATLRLDQDTMPAKTPAVEPPAPVPLPITGTRGYEVRIAKCCHPQVGDSIVGYITRQAVVTVHRMDCATLNRQSDLADRLIPVSWGRTLKSAKHAVPIHIRAQDRAGLMGDIGNIVAQENINMTNVNILSSEGVATFMVTMEVENLAVLSRVLTKIESLECVIEAQRRRNT